MEGREGRGEARGDGWREEGEGRKGGVGERKGERGKVEWKRERRKEEGGMEERGIEGDGGEGGVEGRGGGRIKRKDEREKFQPQRE